MSVGVFLRFRRTFAEVITLSETSAYEFQPNFTLSAFEISHLFSCSINYNINSLLRLCVGMHIIYIYIYIYTYGTCQKKYIFIPVNPLPKPTAVRSRSRGNLRKLPHPSARNMASICTYLVINIRMKHTTNKEQRKKRIVAI